MSHFPGKSGETAASGGVRRLTGALPDVGTGRALRRNLIRLQRGIPGAGIATRIAFKAPSLRYQSADAGGLPKNYITRHWPDISRGSTRMGASKHQPRPEAGFGRGRWLGGLLAMALLAGLTQAANAQGAVRSVHGDWQIRCDTPPGAQGEQCALIQSVVAEDRSNAGLTVIVLKTADQKSKLMRVVAPLGVLLPSGLGLKLDNVDVGRAGFVRCLPNGCVAEVVMDEKLLGQLRTAKTATFIIFETPEEGIGFPLSLNGLGEGYDKLP
jgi:invasion protein IalB